MYGLMNLNYLVERSRNSPRWVRGEQNPIGESDQAFARYVARHVGVSARRKDHDATAFFRDVLGIETSPAPERRRIA